jgi:hypothetical protein
MFKALGLALSCTGETVEKTGFTEWLFDVIFYA